MNSALKFHSNRRFNYEKAIYIFNGGVSNADLLQYGYARSWCA